MPELAGLWSADPLDVPSWRVAMPGWLLGISALVTLGCLARLWHPIRRTTLTGPWVWAVVAVIACTGVELAGALAAGSRSAASADPGDSVSQATLSAWRFVAYSLSICPMMSLLGAKRPQHHAWHFVVAGFWLTLTLPAFESLLRGGGRPIELTGLRAWFLVGLLALAPLNALGTRLLPSCLWLGVAQLIWFAEWLPLFWGDLGRVLHAHLHPSWGTLPAMVGVLWLTRRQNAMTQSGAAPAKPQPRPEIDRLWIDFRDSFSVVWALRVMERINSSASHAYPDLRLSWYGVVGAENQDVPEIPDEQFAALENHLCQILWRFVSEDWISERRTERRATTTLSP